MRGISVLIAALMSFVVMTAVVGAGVEPVSKTDTQKWIRYTVPLPKSIKITGKVSLPKGSVSIVAPSVNDIVIEQAVKELNEAFGGPASGQAAFTVVMTLGGDKSKALTSLKNSEQAYLIRPVGNHKLELVALKPAGMYYAAKTLQQLVNGRKSNTQINMPILSVTDWPDMQDRGLWGSDNHDHLRWMADRKMNMVEQISFLAITPEGQPVAHLKEGREPMVNEGPYYAIKPVPVVLHLEQSGHRIIAVYPELKGKSEHSGVMCYSQPKVTYIIAEWIAQLAALPYVTDVDVWMAENLQGHKGCQCEKCVATGVDPMVLEARAIVKAWRIAEKMVKKDIGLRILTSEATEDYNKTILSELPKNVKVIYYHSLLTYTSGRDPMLRPYLAEFAKNGGWLGVCPNISVVPHFSQPFTSAQFVHYRMKEFYDKKVSGLDAYATPRVHFSYFNVDAAAEWTWNMNGRSIHEFELSYATRNGYKDPEKFAEYADSVGPVLWDAHGSDWIERANFSAAGPVDEQLLKGKLPGLGFVLWDFMRAPFGNIENEKQLNDDVVLADKAVKLAQEMGMEQYVQESRVAQGYIRSQKALYELRGIVKDGKIAPENKASAEKYFAMYLDGLRQVQDALPKWEQTVRRSTDPEGFAELPVKFIQEDCIDRMITTAAKLGVTVK